MIVPDRIPIFPLPNTVLFPGTDLPLQVFEPRYCHMAADAVNGDGILGLVLLRPGWERNYFESPETYAVGCAGRMEDVVSLQDGRYLFRLRGFRKVEVTRFVQREPYRVAEVRPQEEREPEEADPRVPRDRAKLLATYSSLAALVTGRPVSSLPLDAELPYGRMVNLACTHLGFPTEEKQRLLELHDVAERGRRVIALLEQRLEAVLQEQPEDPEESEPVH